ncbi:hypothetical protein HIC20_00580 [Buchnera aphidicola (Hormaphis cornu)]|nr:hypothetical protein HIC20_00580 [Buchnera aphidicola (Hormaphis cornu)]
MTTKIFKVLIYQPKLKSLHEEKEVLNWITIIANNLNLQQENKNQYSAAIHRKPNSTIFEPVLKKIIYGEPLIFKFEATFFSKQRIS